MKELELEYNFHVTHLWPETPLEELILELV